MSKISEGHDTRREKRPDQIEEQGRQTTQPDRTTTLLSRLLTNQEVVRQTHTQKADTAGVTVTTVTVTQQGSWPPPPSPSPPPLLPVADFLRSFVRREPFSSFARRQASCCESDIHISTCQRTPFTSHDRQHAYGAGDLRCLV